MFRRRKPRTSLQSVREFFWPSMGWSRFYQYIKNRVIRLGDTPRNIGLGLAFGAAASFSPFMGTHIIQAIILCFIFRANILAAPIGTLVGNPSTFPFIWFISLYTGLWICRIFGIEADSALTADLSLPHVWEYTLQKPTDAILPWTIGGYFWVALSAPLFYLLFFRTIKRLQKARAKLLARKKKSKEQS